MKRKAANGDEQDAFSRRARRYLRWRPGERSKLKTQSNRRERRQASKRIREEDE